MEWNFGIKPAQFVPDGEKLVAQSAVNLGVCLLPGVGIQMFLLAAFTRASVLAFAQGHRGFIFSLWGF